MYCCFFTFHKTCRVTNLVHFHLLVSGRFRIYRRPDYLKSILRYGQFGLKSSVVDQVYPGCGPMLSDSGLHATSYVAARTASKSKKGMIVNERDQIDTDTSCRCHGRTETASDVCSLLHTSYLCIGCMGSSKFTCFLPQCPTLTATLPPIFSAGSIPCPVPMF